MTYELTAQDRLAIEHMVSAWGEQPVKRPALVAINDEQLAESRQRLARIVAELRAVERSIAMREELVWRFNAAELAETVVTVDAVHAWTAVPGDGGDE